MENTLSFTLHAKKGIVFVNRRVPLRRVLWTVCTFLFHFTSFHFSFYSTYLCQGFFIRDYNWTRAPGAVLWSPLLSLCQGCTSHRLLWDHDLAARLVPGRHEILRCLTLVKHSLHSLEQQHKMFPLNIF